MTTPAPITPSDSGPCLCGQRFCTAKTWPSRWRKTATVLDQDAPEGLDADALDEMVAALEVFAVLAVVLHEAAHVLEHVVMGRHGAEQVPLADAAAGRAAQVDLPEAAVDRDRAQV